MTETSKATIAAVVDMLNARRDQWAPDEQCREAASLISALEAERDRLRAELAKAASALLAAEKRVRDECARLGEEGYDRPVGTPYRSDGVRSKNDQCPHGRYQYEDCERCYAAAIRKGGEDA